MKFGTNAPTADSGVDLSVQSVWRDLKSWSSYKRLFSEIDRHELLILSGSIAYTTALALAPFVIIMLSALSFLDGQAAQILTAQLTDLLGSEAAPVIETIIGSAQKNADFRGVSGLISLIIIAVSASAIFAQLRTSLDKINDHAFAANAEYGVKQFLKDRLLSVGLVFGFIFLTIISLIVTTALAGMFAGRIGALWQVFSYVINISVFTLLFSAMFHYIPSDKFSWKSSVQSGVTATAFFLIGKALIAEYIARSAVGSAYGAAGSLVVLLVWLYYTSLTLLISYQFTKTVLRHEQEPSALLNPEVARNSKL